MSGIKKHTHLEIRRELVDQDYIHKLNDKEKDWLHRFNEEYVAANFKHSGKTLHKSRKKIKDCYDRNNSRNRDILSKKKVEHKVVNVGDIYEFIELEKSPTNPDSYENRLISNMDLTPVLEGLNDKNSKESKYKIETVDFNKQQKKVLKDYLNNSEMLQDSSSAGDEGTQTEK